MESPEKGHGYQVASANAVTNASQPCGKLKKLFCKL